VKPVNGSRSGKEKWVRATCDRIPDDLHVHGWAFREYTHVRRIDSTDSTNWFRDAMNLRATNGLQHLNYGECLEIVIKRYQRWQRTIRESVASQQGTFSEFTEEVA